MCCSVLQCVAVFGGALHPRHILYIWMGCVTHVYEIVLQCVVVCCSVLQCEAVCSDILQCVAVCCSVLQCVAVCCSVL